MHLAARVEGMQAEGLTEAAEEGGMRPAAAGFRVVDSH